MKQNSDLLIEKANTLPLTPGVYIMKNNVGKIIYIGKSKALKNRVSQYFRKGSRHNYKTAKMVSNVCSFDYILTDTEEEALTLESQLIKQHTPKYNIKLKDTKRAPYVRITMGAAFPSVGVEYERKNDTSKYFGPYSNASYAFNIVKTLQKCFKVHKCNKSFPKDIGKERPCLYYQIGDCIGPCTGNVSSEEYREIYKQIIAFMRGSFSDVRKMLTEKMEELSDKTMYEAAAVYRDRIEALSKVWQRHKIVASPDTESDVFAVYSDDAVSCMNVFSVREGRIIDSEFFIFTPDELLNSGDLSAFIFDYYEKKAEYPKDILLNFDLCEEKNGLEKILSERNGHKVVIKTPERGEKKALCDMVYENAARHAMQYKENAEEENMTLIKLASFLHLEVVPDRIESYDVSNYGSEHITAGMVVCEGTKFKKSEYRLFRMKTVKGEPDDYASMKEAITRRFKRGISGDKSFGTYPDLILLDGGKGHVSVVREALRELGIDIPVFGMVKDNYHKTRTLCDEENEISVAKEKSVYMFLYKLQEEVHRFTIANMRSAKEKTVTRSVLEEIDGIGKEKAKSLLAYFGGLEEIKKATTEELKNVKGISQKNAENIISWVKKG